LETDTTGDGTKLVIPVRECKRLSARASPHTSQSPHAFIGFSALLASSLLMVALEQQCAPTAESVPVLDHEARERRPPGV